MRTNPPTNVTIGNCPKAADGTSSCLLVSWNAPTDVKEDMKLEYIVSYRETNATNWKVIRPYLFDLDSSFEKLLFARDVTPKRV